MRHCDLSSGVCSSDLAASPSELMSDIAEGLYVNSLMGMGVNPVTGDYSRGASGFWIERGEIAWPVSELTVAGNLTDIFARLVPAKDLAFRYGTNEPTVRIDGLTVPGSGGWGRGRFLILGRSDERRVGEAGVRKGESSG